MASSSSSSFSTTFSSSSIPQSTTTVTKEEQCIRNQLEFLFSDSNLHKDDYLRTQLGIPLLPSSSSSSSSSTSAFTTTTTTTTTKRSSIPPPLLPNPEQRLPISLILTFPSVRNLTILGDYDKKRRKRTVPILSSSSSSSEGKRTRTSTTTFTPTTNNTTNDHWDGSLHRSSSSFTASSYRDRRQQQQEIEKQQIEYSTLKATYAIASLALVRAAASSPYLSISKDGERIGRKLPYIHNPTVQDPYFAERTIYIEPITPLINNLAFLQKYFSQYGKVTYIRIPRWSPSARTKEKLEQERTSSNDIEYLQYQRDFSSSFVSYKGPIRGFAFVEFAEKESVERVIYTTTVRQMQSNSNSNNSNSGSTMNLSLISSVISGSIPVNFSTVNGSSTTLGKNESSSSSSFSIPEQKMWNECDKLRVFSKHEWEQIKNDAREVLRREKDSQIENTEYGTFFLPSDTVTTNNSDDSSPKISASKDVPVTVSSSTSSLSTIPEVSHLQAADNSSFTYPLHVLIRLTNIPNELSFPELRRIVQVPGRPAYIDCPTLYYQQRNTNNNDNNNNSTTGTVNTTTTTTCTAIVRYFTPSEAMNAYTYFNQTRIQIRNHMLTVTLLDGEYEQQYWLKIFTKQKEYQYQQERIRQFNDANTSMIEGWGGSSVRIPVNSLSVLSSSSSTFPTTTETKISQLQQYTTEQGTVVPWISDQDATLPEIMIGRSIVRTNTTNTKEYVNIDNPHGTTQKIISVASVLQQQLQLQPQSQHPSDGKSSTNELSLSSISSHQHQRKRRRGFSVVEDDTETGEPEIRKVANGREE